MRRKAKSTSSFITEIPLKISPSIERTLPHYWDFQGSLARFEAGRQLYNACLSEALRRKDLMQQSKAYQATRKLPFGIERQQAFHAPLLALRSIAS